MKARKASTHTKQYRTADDTWLVCKPSTTHVVQTTTTQEMRLLGLTADTMQSMDPLDLLIAIEGGQFDDYIEEISV